MNDYIYLVSQILLFSFLLALSFAALYFKMMVSSSVFTGIDLYIQLVNGYDALYNTGNICCSYSRTLTFDLTKYRES